MDELFYQTMLFLLETAQKVGDNVTHTSAGRLIGKWNAAKERGFREEPPPVPDFTPLTPVMTPIAESGTAEKTLPVLPVTEQSDEVKE